jgi:hypothetical protein
MANFGVYLDAKYDPPFEDWWAIKGIDHHMKELSAELIALPCPLPPMLAYLCKTLDKALATRRSEWVSLLAIPEIE